MKGKSRITIAVLLCIAMISSTLFSSAAVFAASGGEEKGTASTASSKIDDYLYDSQIITKDGKPYDPADKLNPSSSFSVKLMFSEIPDGDDARQFPDDGVMTYQIPNIITGFDAMDNLPIKETKGDKKIGTYSIAKSGLITVKLNSDYVKEYRNIKAFLTFEGEFDTKKISGQDKVEVSFSDSVSISVNFEDKASLTVEKTIESNYDYETNTIAYKVSVTTDYPAKNVIVEDTMNKNLELKGALTVTNKGGETVSYKTLDAGDATWKINVGDMARGETYTITYKAKITDETFKEMAASTNIDYKVQAKNSVKAVGDNAAADDATTSTEIHFSRVEKTVVVSKDKKQLIWTIEVNKNKYLDLSGYTLTDTMDEGLILDKSSKMEMKKNDVEVGDVPAWSELSQSDSAWSYTFPPDAGKNSYTFIYKTNIPEKTTVDQLGGTQVFKNNIVLEKGTEKYKGSTPYNAPGPRFMKESYSWVYHGANIVTDKNGDQYLRWTNVITVPSTGLNDFKFVDDIRNDTKPHEFVPGLTVVKGKPTAQDEFNVVNVDGYNGNVKLVQDGNKGFTMYFGTNEAVQKKSSLPATGSIYKVNITCYTKVTGTDNGNRRNWGKIYSGTKSDQDYEDRPINLKLTGSKNGSYEAESGRIKWTVKLNPNYAKLGDTDVIVKDILSGNQTLAKAKAESPYKGQYEVYLNGKHLDASKISKVNGNEENKGKEEYLFNLGELKNNQQYTLTYWTEIKDGILSETGDKVFDNTAKITTNGETLLELPKSVTVKNDIIDKNVPQEPSLSNQFKAGFAITINPNKTMIDPKSEKKADYRVVDTYSKTMEVDLDSFEVKRDDNYVLDAQKDEYSIGHESKDKDNNLLTIVIPEADGHKYTITYTATVKGAVGDNVNYTNTAELFVNKLVDSGVTDKFVKIQKQNSSAGASGSKMVIYVQKRDGAHTDRFLSGAQFKLYKDSVSEENLLGTQTTGDDGKAGFGENPQNNLTYKGRDYYLKAGIKYILVESKAPNGYKKDDTQKVFQLRDDDGNALIADVDAYDAGYVFNVTNEKYNFYIQKTSEHTGEPISGAEFTLFNDIDCKNKVVTAKEGEDGIHTFRNLMSGTYYLKETKVPKGYYNSGKVYTVVIDNNGDATIDGEKVNSENRTYTITNTLSGKITVTKEVKQDGIGTTYDEPFYTALFSNKDFADKNRVSEVKSLEMKGTKAKVTFDNLEIGKTYYVAETDKDGKALESRNNDGGWVISYENQEVKLDPQNLTAESKITNSSFSEYYWSGRINVTKNVKVNGEDRGTNYTFYAGIFEDEAFTKPVGENHVVTLDMNGNNSAEATFEDLAINKTYYVTETDKDGKAITDPQKQLGCEMTIKNNKISLTKEEQTGTVEITNSFEGKHGFKIQKLDAHTEQPLDDAGFTLFNDKDCKDKEAEAVKAEAGIYTFDKLMEGTYYLKETKVPDGYYDPEEVYTVVINADGKVTIDDKAVDEETNTYTITNTLAGKIRVTKEVKQNGVGVPTERTFYAALFNDSEFTKEHLVSEVKALKMNNNESTTVTFDNVKVNETYYVVETDEEGNALTNTADDDTWAIAYDNQVVTLDPNNLTAESKITNSYFDQYYWAGSIDVTKRVTIDGKDFESNSIFYVGLYTDKDCTQQVGDIKPLVMDGKASTTVTFADLPINQTYYVAETDAEGKVITDSQKQLNCEMTIDKNEFTLTEENQTGSAVITNDFHDEEQFYYGGQITVNKTTTFKGKPYKTNEVFYVALFADKAHKERITDAKALKMNGGSAAKVTFENLSYGTYYLAETDKNGKALTELEAADLGFTNLMDEEIKLDGDLAEIGLENQMTEEFVTENGDDPENPKGTATQTGDDSDMALLILGMLAALTTMGILVINGRRRKIS